MISTRRPGVNYTRKWKNTKPNQPPPPLPHRSHLPPPSTRSIRLRHLNKALLLLTILAISVPSALVGLSLPLIELIQHLLGDSVEELLGVDPQQLPGLVEAVEDGALLVRALVDVRLLELLQELERQLVLV